jgi:hypothetical protein
LIVSKLPVNSNYWSLALEVAKRIVIWQISQVYLFRFKLLLFPNYMLFRITPFQITSHLELLVFGSPS